MLKPNILVLGASGNVSHSVLFHLKKVRPFFAKFFLVDKREFIEDKYINLSDLDSQNKKIVTWCIEEFIHELMIDSTEIMLGRDKYISLYPNALFHCENMENLLSPIWKYDSYPNGCILSHEECVTLSQRYDIPFKFIYSVHSSTMNYLKTMEQSEVKVVIDNLLLGDNFNNPLDGSDSIAVRLEYEDKNIYYTNSLKNQDIIGGSATAYQVTVGVYAAIFSLIFDEYQPGIYYPEELAETLYPSYVCANLEINECVMNMNTKKQKWSNIKCKNRKKSNVEINIV